MKVKLEDIITQIDFASTPTFLNKSTREIHLVPEDLNMLLKEDDFDEERLTEWEMEFVPIVRDIRDNPDNYIPLPDQFDINDYDIMESFALSLKDDLLREEIYSLIKGTGVFRRFQEKISRAGIKNECYKFRDKANRENAINWCKSHNIEYY